MQEQTRLRAEGVTVPAPQPALPANDSAPPAAGTPAPPLSPPEEAPLPRVASWSDRLSTPKHPKPSVFKNAQKAAPSQATASVKGGMAKCHEDGPRSPKPRPLSPAIRRQQNQERAPEGDSRAVADANRPQPTIQTGQSQVNGTDGSLIEKQESIMVKRHVACGDRQPFADPRRSTGELSGTEPVLENPGRNATEAPEGEHFFEAFHQTGRTVSGERQFSERPQQRAGDLPAGKSNLSLGAGKVPEAAAVSALCDLLLQHMEALEASKLEVRAAAAGAAALGEARAAEHEEERNKTGRNASGRKESGRKENGRNESGRNEGARKDKGATERAEKGSGRVGNNEGRPNGGLDSSGLNRRVKREVTEEPVLSILPEKLEATAGAMAKELTAMRAALAVLAQGLGDLHAPRGHQPGTVSVGTAVQTERVSQTDFAVQTVGSVREEDETRGRLVVNSGATVEYHASTNNETPVQIGAPVRSKTRAQTDASAQTEAFSKSDRTAQTEATVARTATAQTDVTIDGTVVRTGIALDRTVDQAEKVLDGSLGGLVRRSSGVLQDQCDAIFQTDLPVPLPALTGPTDALRSVAVSNRPELQSAGVTETAPLLRIADAINTTERFEAWGKIDPVGSDQSLGESEAVRVDTNPEESGAVQPVVPTTVLRAASERTSGHVAEGGQARPHGNGVVYPRAEQEKNIAAGAVQFHSALESDGSNHRRALGVGTEGVIARGLGGESNGESLVHQGADRTAEGLVGGSNRDGLIPWGAARVAAEQTAGSGRELTGGPVRHFAAEQSQVRLSPTSDAPPGLPTQSELSVHPSPVDSGVIAVGEFRGSEQGTSPQRTLVTMERRPLGPDDLAFAVVPVFKDRGTQQAEPVQREAHPALTDAAVSGMRAVVTTCEVGTMTDPVVETMLRAVPITSSAHEREKSRSLPGRLSGKGGNTENVEKGTETELEETAERAAQTYLESADRSAGPGPGAEATETEVSLREAQVEKLHSEASLREAQLEKLQTEVSVREAQLEKAQKAVEEWERRCAAVEQERVKMVEAARQREVLLETRLELERRSRDEEGRRHDEQVRGQSAATCAKPVVIFDSATESSLALTVPCSIANLTKEA